MSSAAFLLPSIPLVSLSPGNHCSHRCSTFTATRIYPRRRHQYHNNPVKATAINDAAPTIEPDSSPPDLQPPPPTKPLKQRKPSFFSLSPVDRSIARISVPALGALSLEPLVSLADTAFIGHLGAASLGGVSVSNLIFNLSFTCFNFLYLATTPAVARAFGSNDHEEASRIISQGLWIAIIVGVVVMTLLSTNASFLVGIFCDNNEVAPYAVTYLKSRIVAAPFFLMSMVANGAFRGFQDTRTTFYAGLVASTVNLMLFPTLIFWRKLGIAGAGFATAAGHITSGCCLFMLLLKSGRLRARDLVRKPRWKELSVWLRTGAVLSVRTLSIFTTISFATKTTTKLGTVPLAAFEIGRQLFTLFGRLLDAISVSAQSIVALALGQGQYKRARQSANRILKLGFILGSVFFTILMLSAKHAPKLFTSNPAVQELVSKTFPLFAIIQPINGLVMCLDGVYTAGRKFGFLTSAIFSAALLSISSLFLVRYLGLGLPGVWMSLNLMMLMRAVFLGLGYLSRRWTPVPWETREVLESGNGTPAKSY